MYWVPLNKNKPEEKGQNSSICPQIESVQSLLAKRKILWNCCWSTIYFCI